jgi:hypothetical protein
LFFRHFNLSVTVTITEQSIDTVQVTIGFIRRATLDQFDREGLSAEASPRAISAQDPEVE